MNSMNLLNIILHLDNYLGFVIANYHDYFYILFFLVIFCETGLVVTPFLPGDSLLFVAGAFAGTGQLQIASLSIILVVAAFSGDNLNFFLGQLSGKQLFSNPKSKIFRQDLMLKTHDFYQYHGTKALIIARFIPLLRTFAPFVAGIGRMNYSKFILCSLIASLLWVMVFLLGGYFFGNLTIVRQHLSLIIAGVMLVSLLPALKMLWDNYKIK
jgi:membrane-associated protein